MEFLINSHRCSGIKKQASKLCSCCVWETFVLMSNDSWINFLAEYITTQYGHIAPIWLRIWETSTSLEMWDSLRQCNKPSVENGFKARDKEDLWFKEQFFILELLIFFTLQNWWLGIAQLTQYHTVCCRFVSQCVQRFFFSTALNSFWSQLIQLWNAYTEFFVRGKTGWSWSWPLTEAGNACCPWR
jgi:hypothetical protein